ncbi:MAG: carbon-nitrogen hydrolase family protein [Pseudomonadota bacterium]
MSTIGIAVVQLTNPSADFEGCLSAIRKTAKRYAWVDMIVIGELALNGVSLDKAEPAGGPTEQALCDLARELDVWLVPGSIYETRGGQIFNMTPVISPSGEIIARYDKMFPFAPYEKNVAYGENYVVFDVPGVGRFGTAICYDVWYPEAIRTLAAMGAEVVLAPTRTNTMDRDVEIALARANAVTNQCYFLAVNMGGEAGLGRSVICGPGGEIIHESGVEFEAVAVEVDLELVRRARERGWNGLGQTLKTFRDAPAKFPFHADPSARAEAFGQLGPLTMPGKPNRANEPADVQTTPADIHIIKTAK